MQGARLSLLRGLSPLHSPGIESSKDRLPCSESVNSVGDVHTQPSIALSSSHGPSRKGSVSTIEFAYRIGGSIRRMESCSAIGKTSCRKLITIVVASSDFPRTPLLHDLLFSEAWSQH